jgi:hypothetical protein
VIEYGSRTKRLPAPPHVVWEDLVARTSVGVRAWLVLREGEVMPEVVTSSRPDRVVWSSLWPERPGDLLEMTLASQGHETALRFSLLADGEPPEDDLRHRIRYRVNELLYHALRQSYDQ